MLFGIFSKRLTIGERLGWGGKGARNVFQEGKQTSQWKTLLRLLLSWNSVLAVVSWHGSYVHN